MTKAKGKAATITKKDLTEAIEKAVDFLVERLGGMILENRKAIEQNTEAIGSLQGGQTDIKRQIND